jgi:hypothetical protein
VVHYKFYFSFNVEIHLQDLTKHSKGEGRTSSNQYTRDELLKPRVGYLSEKSAFVSAVIL